MANDERISENQTSVDAKLQVRKDNDKNQYLPYNANKKTLKLVLRDGVGENNEIAVDDRLMLTKG